MKKNRNKTITINDIARIEGHAGFVGDMENNKPKQARIKVYEGARLFESILIGRTYQELPEITSRICGICPVIHNLTALKSIEAAFGVKINNYVRNLRHLMLLGQLINSHALHIFFFSASDFFNIKSDLELIKKFPQKTKYALQIRATANQIVETIGGRSIHPVNSCVGGFRQDINKSQLLRIKKSCQNTLSSAIKLAQFFIKLKYPKFPATNIFACLTHVKEYAIYDGQVKISSRNNTLKPEKFIQTAKEIQLPQAVAKRSFIDNQPYFVGALARINTQADKLELPAKKLWQNSPLRKQPANSFYNIMAQAIEITHSLAKAIKLCTAIIQDQAEYQIDCKPQPGRGVAMAEAPRGLLIYDSRFDKKGKITNCNIITPTAQSLANLEKDLKLLLELKKDLPASQKKAKIKMLIRAYDPCVTCATH